MALSLASGGQRRECSQAGSIYSRHDVRPKTLLGLLGLGLLPLGLLGLELLLLGLLGLGLLLLCLLGLGRLLLGLLGTSQYEKS